MSQFFLSGLLSTLLFLLPLSLLPLVAAVVYRLRRRPARPAADAADLDRINFNIFKYVVYLLVIPAIMLVTSVIIGYANDMAAVLDSLIWLIVAITIAFTWCIYRLVLFVSAKSRLEEQLPAE